MTFFHRPLQAFFLLWLSAVFFPLHVSAAAPEVLIRDSGYAAQYVSQSVSDPIEIEEDGTTAVVFRFKNVGSKTWNAGGKNYISAYTMEPRNRDSQFFGENWLSMKQTAKISGVVRTGEIGELALELVARDEPGEYVERFYLAAENKSWVQDGYFFVKIRVVEKQEQAASPPPEAAAEESPVSAPLGTLPKAKRIGLSPKEVSIAGGEQVRAVAIFQNLGETEWPSYSIVLRDSASLAHNSWEKSNVVVSGANTVAPGASVRETFYFTAPERAGTYTASFRLAVEGEIVEDAPADIAVHVTADAPEHISAPSLPPSEVFATTTRPRLSAEPRIRVGLWKDPGASVQFVSFDDDYRVFAGENETGILPAKKVGILKYASGVYSFSGGDLDFTSGDFIRLEPASNPRAVFTLLNYHREVKWKGPVNFNKYRGAYELRATQDGSTLYGINDLLFEDYTAGIGENSNGAPMEYLKAQTVAQRTYAYYIKEHSDKHNKRNFDVVATTGDQLYLGVGSEGLMPRFLEAVAATRGYMATYDTDSDSNTDTQVVITPYFGNSDGRTRAWTDVWGGAHKPWLVPVSAQYDEGRRMFGHGVGMSQRDAALRAEAEGLLWEQLVKYYYSGVELTKMYE